jgi:hypothetical protein
VDGTAVLEAEERRLAGRGAAGRGGARAADGRRPARAGGRHPRERGGPGAVLPQPGRAEKGDLLPTLEAIEELARAPGLTPGRRAFQREDVEKARVERVAVTLPLSGSYDQLVGFLREVEASPRFLTVDRVAMRADRDGGAALQVELSTYLRRAAEAGRGGRRGR